MEERLREVAQQATKVSPPADMRVKLSILWVFAVLNYIYADVFTALDPSTSTGSVPMSHATMLGAAILMETAIVMVPLARLLAYQPNRWGNVLAGVIHTVAVIASLFVTGKLPALYYIFFACVEGLTTSIIVWLAWKWKEAHEEFSFGPMRRRGRRDAGFPESSKGEAEDTSRKGNLCTLRGAGGVSGASERSEATLGYPLIGVPGVIAGEVDVLPAKWRDVLEQGGIELP